MRRSSVHHPRVVLVAPEIILAIVSPLSSLTSIRIGFGLELSIAKPVRSEVLKRNRIAGDSSGSCFHCFKNSSRHASDKRFHRSRSRCISRHQRNIITTKINDGHVVINRYISFSRRYLSYSKVISILESSLKFSTI